MFILEEYSLQEISSLPNRLRFMLSMKDLVRTCTYVCLCTNSEHREITPCVKWPSTEGENNEKFLKRLIVGVAYKRWSLTIGSDYRTLTGKSLFFWRGSRLRQVVAHGFSTVL